MNELSQQVVPQQVMQQIPDTFPGMFLGYTVFWLAIAAYVFYLGVRVARLEKMKP